MAIMVRLIAGQGLINQTLNHSNPILVILPVGMLKPAKLKANSDLIQGLQVAAWNPPAEPEQIHHDTGCEKHVNQCNQRQTLSGPLQEAIQQG